MDENRKRIEASGVRDKIVVWGRQGCEECVRVLSRLSNMVREPVNHMDVEEDLKHEPQTIRNEVMALIKYQDGVLPVVQINRLVMSPADAFAMLGGDNAQA